MPEASFRILIADDDADCRSGLARALSEDATEVATAEDGDEALSLFHQARHHLVITDLKMPGAVSGLDVVKQVKLESPETFILVITAHGSVETAVEAMREGAHDYICKPVDLGMLRLHTRNALEHHRIVEENRRLREQLADIGQFPEILGEGAGIREVLTKLRQVAGIEITVLIHGESGTGKELVARAIHDLSARRNGPFVAANAGALPESLIESELFGHEKGAFTGANRAKPGWFEMAKGGTLFLDEIGEMPLRSQVDLLRVLEQHEVRRLGGEQNIPLDVRLIAATNRNLEALVGEGKFREDLYYRLNVMPLCVPPLRERRDDIPLLAQSFLEQVLERHGKKPKQLAGAAMRILCDYPWPGNVRQLKNCMERLSIMVEGESIHAEDLPEEFRAQPRCGAVTLEAAVEEAERSAILAALAQCHQHRERTAQLLGISVRTLHYKMNRHALQ